MSKNVFITVKVEVLRGRFDYVGGASTSEIEIEIPENLIPSLNLGETIKSQIADAMSGLTEMEAEKEAEKEGK